MDQHWLAHHCAFVINNFFKNNELITITQILFRIHFNVACHGAIPGQNTIVRWITNFQNTASAFIQALI